MTLEQVPIGVPYILRVACPECHARINELCTSSRRSNANISSSHKKRWDASAHDQQNRDAIIVVNGIEHRATYHYDHITCTSGYQLDDGTIINHTFYTWLRWAE